jgi:hypothetical protein
MTTEEQKPIKPRAKKPRHLFKVPAPIRLPRWLKDWLDDQDEPNSALIEQALCDHFEICAPVYKIKKNSQYSK